MEPWQSWAVAVCIGGAAFLYYSKDSKYFMKAKPVAPFSFPADEAPTSTTRRRGDKQNARRKDAGPSTTAPGTYAEAVSSGTSNASNATSKKRKAGRAPTAPTQFVATPEAPAQLDDGHDDDAAQEDKDWAKQLAAKKKGVTLQSSKSLGQGRINVPQSNGNIDLSQSKAAASDKPALVARTGDVSDMLEPRAAGPSVIRVTGGEEQPKKAQTPRAAAAHETKKQRQNRRKVEEKKVQREEDEKQRQVLLEGQRRTARQARGEPAKNGMATSKAPATSAWSDSVQSGRQANGSGPTNVPAPRTNETSLLDTFDHDALSTSSSNDPHTSSTTPATVASTYDPDFPSEESQMEALNALNQDSGWNEVSVKGKKGKKKADTSSTQVPTSPSSSSGKDSNPYSAISNSEAVNGGTKYTSKPASKAKTNGFAALGEATDYTPAVKGHPDDSDWSVY